MIMSGRFFRQVISFILMPALIISTVVSPAAASSYRLAPRNFNEMYAVAARGDVRLLLEAVHRGMNINATNAYGDTGLCVAAKRRNATAYNAFRQAGANPDHPCTWKIPYYQAFIESDAVQAGATWQSADYVPPVYNMEKSNSKKWALAGLLLAGGGIALLLNGGGGGGGGGDETAETPGLSCEFGCAEEDENGNCLVCNDPPVETCEENPCAEGCYTNLTCTEGYTCAEQNSCGGCERCEQIDVCKENPCAEGCYTDLTCTAGQVCSSYNSCGGCESCITEVEPETNFVIETDNGTDNSENLTNTGTNKSETWGGIYASSGGVDNTGNIVLADGYDGVGIMATHEPSTYKTFFTSIDSGVGAISNSGTITITADDSYGILTETLGSVINSKLESLHTLENNGTVYLNGRDNIGIMLLGNGVVYNSGDITLTGTATFVIQDNSLNGAHDYNYIEPSTANLGIYLTLDGRSTGGLHRSYDIEKELINSWNNEGNITLKLTTDERIEKGNTSGKDKYMTVAGMNVSAIPLNEFDKIEVNNSGAIDVNFSFDETYFANLNHEDVNAYRDRYRAMGLSVLNKGENVSKEDESTLIKAENSGKITMTGNATMQALLIDGVKLTNHGDIYVDMNSQYYESSFPNFVAGGLVAQHSIIDQYANIDYQISGIGGYFYSVNLGESILNVQSGATLNGNIEAYGSTINNAGTLTGAEADMGAAILNNLAGGVFDVNIGEISETHNSGNMFIGALSGYESRPEYGTFVNEEGGVAEIGTLGSTEGHIADENKTGYLESVINRGTLKTYQIRTKEFENSGQIEAYYLSYYSYKDNGTVDLSNVHFKSIDSIINNTGGQHSVLQLNSRYQDNFIVGDITNVDQYSGTIYAERFPGGAVLHYTDWYNDEASADKRSSLSVNNIKALMHTLEESDDPQIKGLVIDRNYVDATLNNSIDIDYPDKIAGVQLNGQSVSFTNNGTIDLTGAVNLKGIESNGNGNTVINSSALNLTATETEGENQQSSKAFGIYLTGDAGGYNEGSITITGFADGVGIYAEGTSADGFENRGSINIDSENAVSMYANGSNHLSKLINKGTLEAQTENATGMLADGSLAEIINDFVINISGYMGIGMMGQNNAKLTNNGTISIDIKDGIGMYADSGQVINSSTGKINDRSAGASGRVGIYLEKTATGYNEGNITLIGDNQYGVYATGTGEEGFENRGSITLTGGKESTGMFADGYVDGVNDNYVKLINRGAITVSGTNAVGMYANGSKSVIVNQGTITVSGSGSQETETINGGTLSDDTESAGAQAFALTNGAKFYNLGVLEAEDSLNLDALADEKSKTVAGKNSIIKTGSVSGTLYGGADLTTGSNDDYYESRVIEAEENNATAASDSAMFAAEMIGDKIAMTRYDFNKLMANKNLASYLENNYQQGNRIDVFDTFKTAEDTTKLNNVVAETLGTNFVPAFAYQNFARLRHINRTMADLMQNNASEKDERVSVVSDNYYHDIKAHDGVSGYEERLFGFSGLFDKKINNNFRYGIGLGVYRVDTDFDNGVNRDDNLFEVYNPYWFDYERWGALIIPYVGFSDGDYERYDDAKKHTADLKAYYYGLNNRIYLKKQASGINIEPTAEINLSGMYQDDFAEDGGISVKAKNMFSAEAGLGAYLSKAADFGAKGKLNLKAGAMYYYELNDDAYQNINARFAGMNGLYEIAGYDNSRSRGVISLKTDYQFNGWNVYAEIMRLLEHNDNMVYNAGLKYSF